tara:strand:- start:863 stop:4630 length:3768 start_codon:yes stop_codon:yes gene_type:complete
MKNKNKEENMIIKFLRGIARINAVLFLFLGLLFSQKVKSQCPPIIDYAVITNVACYDSATGSIDLVLFNTTPFQYTFNWNNLEVSEDINDLIAATYTVQIIDNTDPTCTQDTSFIITQSPALVSSVNLLQNVPCFGDSTGAAFASVIGGTPFLQGDAYTYLWSNGETTPLADSLWGDPSAQGTPFTHTITFTDSLGCTLTDNIDVINNNSEITGVINVIENVSCFGACDAYAELSSSGGVLQHTYFWDIGQTYNGSGPDTAFNLCYGGHDVIIEDALGCRKTVPFNITEPDELQASAEQVQPVQCYGFNDGIAQGFATGGTTPYTFVWDSLTGQLNDSAFNLTPGIHTVYVTDANGCTSSDTVIIMEPTQLEIIIDDTMTVYSYCLGVNSGELCVIASGGTPFYTYQWDDVLAQSTACASNLVPDVYTCTVIDDRQCIASVSFDLDSVTNTMSIDSVITNITHVSCFGLYDGSIGLSNVVGGVSPYTYSWNGPGTYTGSGANISSLYAGSYSVVIEDVNGCARTMSIDVDQPDQLEYVTYNAIDETCFGADDGEIWVSITGGSGNYFYDNSFSGIFPIPNPNQEPIVNDSLILDLSEGNYDIYITDDNNCEGAVIFGGTWQEYVGPGLVLGVSGVVTDDASYWCYNDGGAWIQWPGANPLYNYTWEDANNTILGTGDTIWGLFPGNYSLVVHYADSASFGQNYIGCDFVQPFTINLNNGNIGDYIYANATIIDESCYGFNDGSIILAPTADVGGAIELQWDTTTSNPGGSTPAIDSLQPGVYTVTITDAAGCHITEDFIVEAAIAITAEILEPVQPLCHGDTNGIAEIIVNSSVLAPIEYIWKDIFGDTVSTNASTGQILSAGTYLVLVTDGNGCQDSFPVTVEEPEAVFVNIEVSPNVDGYHISCFNGVDGVATAIAGGGTLPYDYEWLVNGQNTQIATNLSAGVDSCVLTDSNGCSDTATIILEQPSSLNPNIFENVYSYSANGDTNEISCFGMSDGWVRSDAFGGVQPYDYKWVKNSIPSSIVSTEYIADNLPAGYSYTITVTDKYECVADTITSVFVEPVEFIANVTTTNYAGPTHGPFTVNFEDTPVSNDPYSFEWISKDVMKPYNGGGSGITLMTLDFEEEDLGENFVYLIVTNDSTGCVFLDTFFIEIQGIPEISNVFTPNGDDINEVFSFGEYGMKGIVDIQIFNRWGQLVYLWADANPNENNQSQEWDGTGIDGKDVPEGVYFYILKADGQDGHYYERKGSVTLLR